MHYEITASQQAVRKNLTSAQRNSSLFSEAPRIGGRTLRRGQVLKFDESQFKTNEILIKRLFDAGAIEVVHVVGDKRADLRSSKFDSETIAAEGKAPPVESSPTLTPVPETKTQSEVTAIEDAKANILAESAVITPAPEPAVEPAPVVEAAPVVPEVAQVVETVPAVEAAPVEQGKGKKGKK